MAWALQFDGVNDYVDLDTPVPFHQDRTSYRFYSEFIRDNSSSAYFVSRGGAVAAFESSIRLLDTSVRVRYAGTGVQWSGLSILKTTDVQTIEITRDGNTHELFINGVSQGTQSSSATSTQPVRSIGRAFSDYSDFKILVISLYDDPVGGSLLFNWDATASSHSAGTPILTDTVGGNNATGANMPTDGSAWVDLGGGGVAVTGATPSFNYSSIAASIDLTGSIDVTGQTANYTYSVVNGSIDLTGDISVIGLTPNQSYSSVNGIIELGAVISVVGLTPNYNYQGITGEVSLNGEILVSGETPSYSYLAIKGFVTTGEAQAIGTVTSSFASDVYLSGFKPNTITVNFKS